MTNRCIRTVLDLSPREVGVNAAAGNASTNSNNIAMDGCNFILIDATIVNATGGALTLSAYPEIRRKGTTAWAPMPTGEIVAGVDTLSGHQVVFPATDAAAATYARTFWMDVPGFDGYEFRLRAVTAAGAGATDLLSIRLIAGHSGA
jgi:hypothetical protein